MKLYMLFKCRKPCIPLKVIRVMKLVFILWLTALLQVNAAGYAQRISMSVKNAPLTKAFREIQKQTNYNFLYNTQMLQSAKPVNINVSNATLEEVLRLCLYNQPLSFSIMDETIIISKKPAVLNISQISTEEVAPPQEIKGKVVDEKGAPLPGVSIKLKKGTVGTTTDIDGNFSLTIAEPGILVFSYLGFLTQEVSTSGRNSLNITLAEDQKALSEVVVVGYGTQNKKDVSSAIGSLSVGNKKLADLPITSPEQLLQGRVGGVNITQDSGTPGGRSTVRIRGASSITGGNDPLYVVDGIPVNAGNYAGAAGGSVPQNPLSNISPNDIESMDILKDASAAAIYGSRASNGVIVITTKRGKENQTKISYNAYFGYQEVAKRIPLLGGPEWGELINEANTNVGRPAPIANPQSLTTTDWQDEIFRRAPIHNNEISLSGGTKNTQYFLSGSYLSQTGVVIGSGFNRGNFRFNFDQKINNRLKAGINMSMNRSKTDRVSSGDRDGIVAVAIVKSPAVPARRADGTLNPDDPYISNIDNPLIIADQVRNDAFNNRALGNAFVEFKIIEGLNLRSSIGLDYLSLEETYFVPPNALTVTGRTTNGTGTNSMTQDIGWINENTLTYNKKLGENHRFDVLLGYSNQESKFDRTIASASNFALEAIQTLGSASIKNSTSSGSSWGLTSYFSRLNYSFKDKFNLSASYRVDGSSRFSENNKYGSFPSISAAYRLGQESFMKDLTWVEDVKIRASWGQTGNQEIGNFTSRGLFAGGFNYIGLSGLAQTQLANPDLSWESTEQTNIGLDLSFFKGRLGFTIDAYKKNTSGLLLAVSLPRSSGFVSSLQNVGNVENKGIELSLNTVNVSTTNFKWSTDFNISFNRNKVTNLPGGQIPLGFNGYASIVKEGYPLGTFYGWKIIRVNPQTGDYDFVDVNGDKNIPLTSTTEDNLVIGSAQPKFTGGFTNSVSYKNFDASVFLHFVSGNQIFNQAEYSYGRLHTWFNSSTLARERWRKPGDITTLHRAAWADPNRNGSVSDRVLQDGSFLRIKNIALGYNLKNAYLKKVGIQNIRIYGAGQNIFTWTKYRGYDPEVNAYGNDTNFGFDLSSYPQARSFSVGLNATF
jgi:TonB-linked SusC/RagA family outer membrane protein